MNGKITSIAVEGVVIRTEGIGFADAQKFGDCAGRALQQDLAALTNADPQKISQAVDSAVQRAANQTFTRL